MKIGDVSYLRILLTTRCNLQCRYCHQEGVNCNKSDIDAVFLLDIIQKMKALGFRKFKFMGGEPMLYQNLTSVVAGVKKLIGDADLSMISNGTASFSSYEEIMMSGMDRLNVSVHGWSSEAFCSNTGCSGEIFDRIRQTIISLAEKKLIGKINYVVRKGVNESDFFKLVDFAGRKELVVDALNLLDTKENFSALQQWYSMLEIERLVCSKYDIKDIYENTNSHSLPSRRLLLQNGAVVNLKISKLNDEHLFCDCLSCVKKKSCMEGIKAMRLTPAGILQPCLMRTDNTLDLVKHNSVEEIEKYLKKL